MEFREVSLTALISDPQCKIAPLLAFTFAVSVECRVFPLHPTSSQLRNNKTSFLPQECFVFIQLKFDVQIVFYIGLTI